MSFAAESPSATRVEVCHRGLERYGDAAEEMRGIFGAPYGWAGTLERFAEVASG